MIQQKIVFIAAFLLSFSYAYADTIYFKNGMRLDIEEAWEDDGKIKCKIFDSVVVYSKEEIDRVEKFPREKNIVTEEENVSGKESPKYPPDGKLKDLSTHDSVHQRRVENILQQAKRMANQGDWSKAIEMGKKGFELAPENLPIRKTLAYSLTGYAYLLAKGGQTEVAIENLKEALYYVSEYPSALKGLSVIYLDQAIEAFNLRNYETSKVILVKAFRYDRKNFEIHVLLGKIAYHNDNYVDARISWQEALRLNPDLTEVRMLLANLEQDRKVEDQLQTSENGNFVLKFQKAEKKNIAEKTIMILNWAYNDVGLDFDVYPDEKIFVLIYPKSDLKNLNYLPDWSAGVYDGKIRFGEDLCERDDYFKAVLYHEYTHTLVHILGGRKVPLWLNEGLAEYESRRFKSGEFLNSGEAFLHSAAANNNLIPLKVLVNIDGNSLSRLPVEGIRMVYVQSESFVTYLIRRFSMHDIKSILVDIGRGKPLGEAIYDTFHTDLEALEAEWKNQFLR